MNILLFSDQFPNMRLPNAGVFNLDRARELTKRGHKIIVIAPVLFAVPLNKIQLNRKLFKELQLILKEPKTEYYEEILVYRPKWFRLPNRHFWHYNAFFLKLFCGKYIKKQIVKHNIEVIIASTLNPFGAYAKYFWSNNTTKFVTILEGSDILIAPNKYSNISKIIRDVNRSDHTIFVSNSFKSQVVKAYTIKNPVVIENGFNKTIFRFSPQSLTNGSKLILSIGNLYYIKGHDILLNAMTLLEEGFKLKIIGAGDKNISLYNGYQQLIEYKNLMNKVELVGECSPQKIRQYIDSAYVVCFPSRSESFCIAALESLACGKPLIGSDIPRFKELIIPGFNGLIFASESVSDLAQKIIEARNIQWDYEAIATDTCEKYGWDIWAKHMESLFA